MEIKLLVKQAKKGNKEALLKLVMAEEDDYYKLAYVYMKNKDDSLDALQDMIIILYENISKLRKEEAFYSWSKTILVNLCKSKLKENKKLVPIEKVKEVESYEVYGNIDDSLMLEDYLSQLNDIHEEVIRLRYLLDLDYKAISDILNVPLGTVKSRLSIGMDKLKGLMGGGMYE